MRLCRACRRRYRERLGFCRQSPRPSRSPALNPQAYTHGMAKLPGLVTTETKAGYAVAWKCSECDKSFTLHGGLPAYAEQLQVVDKEFEKHWKAAHSST